MKSIPVRKREIFGWCCFDFANSAFTTIVITVVYSVYFHNVVAQGHPLAKSWWGNTLALSQLLVILVSPWLGALADIKARKKEFLMVSAIACSLLTASLFWTGEGMVLSALAIVLLANLTFSLSENFCASFLPEISTPKNCGRISGYGWSFGYMGGLVSLALALWIVSGENGATRAAWTFPMTGAFFLIAALPTFFFLRERAEPRPLPARTPFWLIGWKEVLQTLRTLPLPQHRTLAWFFVCFTLFMSGLFAVIYFAALFANEVLHLSQAETIGLFIALQISSAIGAFAFGFFQDRFGSKNALIVSLLLWLVVSGWAAVCQTKMEFFLIGNLAGLGIGSLQSASRAVVSVLTPVKQSGEIFGFWGLFGKLGAVAGPLTLGWVATWWSFRAGVAFNGLFFLAGLVILLTLDLQRAER